MATERCPACGTRLNVPEDFRRGPCPACGQELLSPRPRKRRANPSTVSGRGATARKPAETALARPYRAFHGVKPRRTRTLNVDLPEGWWLLGDLQGGAIEYVPPPNSQHRSTVFRHSFGDLGGRRQRSTAKLYVSPDGKAMMIRGNFDVGGRGIVG